MLTLLPGCSVTLRLRTDYQAVMSNILIFIYFLRDCLGLRHSLLVLVLNLISVILECIPKSDEPNKPGEL